MIWDYNIQEEAANWTFEELFDLPLPTRADFMSRALGLVKNSSNQRADKNNQDRDNLYCCDTLWKKESGKEQDKDDRGLTKHANQRRRFRSASK